jgi:hypothetical protein
MSERRVDDRNPEKCQKVKSARPVAGLTVRETPKRSICCQAKSSSNGGCPLVWRLSVVNCIVFAGLSLLEARQRLVDGSSIEEPDALGGAICTCLLASTPPVAAIQGTHKPAVWGPP